MRQKQAKRKFLKIYDQYNDAIFRFCFSRTGDRELACDITQDVFIKTWDYMMHKSKIEQPKSFLYRVAFNSIVDHSRKIKEQSLDYLNEKGFEPSSGSNLHEDVVADIEYTKIMALLNELEPVHRDVLLLRYVDGLGPKEIAVLLKESENVISVRITRAKSKLKKLLKEKNL